MEHNFTSNDLLLYIYNELDPHLVPDMKVALQIDSRLADTYYTMLETLEMLDAQFCEAY